MDSVQIDQKYISLSITVLGAIPGDLLQNPRDPKNTDWETLLLTIHIKTSNNFGI